MNFSLSLHRKLRSNNPPTNEEATAVRRTLAGSLSRLHTLEDQVGQLQRRLDYLSLERQELHHFVDDHRRLLSPFRRLVPDILQEIFFHCLPTAHNPVMSLEEAPLLLGRVCSQWRQVAYSTPKLWASIHIVATLADSDEAKEEAISAWLSRSGILPLSISMSTSGNARSPRYCCIGRRVRPSNGQVQPYLNLISPYMQRWKSVHLCLKYFDWADFFSQYKASDFPLLESIHIEGDRPKRRTWQNGNDTLFLPKDNTILQAPRLRALSMAHRMPRLLDTRVQWAQLTALNLGTRSLHVEDVVKALIMCPNLEACAVSPITYAGNQSPQVDASPPPLLQMASINLPKLRTLSIINRATWNDHLIILFEHLSTPALRHFSYERTVHIFPDSPDTKCADKKFLKALYAFLQKLVQPLEEFDFYTYPFIGNYVIKTLPLIPGLKRLSLKGYSIHPTDSRYHLASPSLNVRMDDEFLAHFIPNTNKGVDGLISPLVLSDTSDDEDGKGDDYGDFGHDDTPTNDDNSPSTICLCPKLEVLHCTDAQFSDRCLLEFLRARSIDCDKHNLAHLRRVGISFAIPATSRNKLDLGNRDAEAVAQVDMVDQIGMLGTETGLVVDLRDPPSEPFPPRMPQVPKYSPHAGLKDTSTSPVMLTGYFGF